jgi:signal transduction protein with GAF and PtsI domain
MTPAGCPTLTMITSREPWSVICVPIINRSRTIGAATLHKAGLAQFAPSDVDLLATIANQVASFIENARLLSSHSGSYKFPPCCTRPAASSTPPSTLPKSCNCCWPR